MDKPKVSTSSSHQLAILGHANRFAQIPPSRSRNLADRQRGGVSLHRLLPSLADFQNPCRLGSQILGQIGKRNGESRSCRRELQGSRQAKQGYGFGHIKFLQDEAVA